MSGNGSKLTITQNPDKAILNWQSFNIGSNEHTVFIQPYSSSVALNRINHGNSSEILGRLGANGQLMLVFNLVKWTENEDNNDELITIDYSL
ncbi:filamentous hemagglutinin N-terminal domain-containing protein [endosymbiont of Acanthamoeba sp. UWC8]|uniref:filamentous hemagglutinin N-terminal domain-containing protein n=1 Tax=endosymbiont of Acanthamoeba sp. UWC8 TaxID=86106 RepID=UPI000A015D0E